MTVPPTDPVEQAPSCRTDLWQAISGDLAEVLSAPRQVPIGTVRISGTPRLAGEDFDHVLSLAVSNDPVPPIIVHRPSMSVIDGRHRLRAAELRGARHIDAVHFDGTEMDAFVIAVWANIVNGLPLTVPDRTAAAGRILRTHLHWSDRAIAQCTGLSAKVVGNLRRRSSAVLPDSQTRVGRDGKWRPLDATGGRARAAALIEQRPEASLREIAREAGISPSTVRDVRARLNRGENPMVRRGSRGSTEPVGGERSKPVQDLVSRLREDPSLRLSNSGRALLRLVSALPLDPAVWEQFAEAVPPQYAELLARIAHYHAASWERFAAQLTRNRTRATIGSAVPESLLECATVDKAEQD